MTCYSQVLRCKNIMGHQLGFSLLMEGAWILQMFHLKAGSEPRALEWASGRLGQGRERGDSEKRKGLHTVGSEQQRDWVSLSHLFPGPEPTEAGPWHLSLKTVVFLAGCLVLTVSVALTLPSRGTSRAERRGPQPWRAHYIVFLLSGILADPSGFCFSPDITGLQP